MQSVNKNKIKNKHRPTLYSELSNYIFNYDEFTMLFNNRIKMLKDIEEKHSSLSNFNTLSDISSHFIARLVLSYDIKTTKWFIKRETQLFKYRLQNNRADFTYKVDLPFCSSSNKIEAFFYKNSVTREINLEDNFLDIVKTNTYMETSIKKFKPDQKLQVHFSRISQLLAIRNFIPKKGFTTINFDSRDVLLANNFRFNLESKMSFMVLSLRKNPDERLERLCQTVFTEEFVKPSEKCSLVVHEKYFPPCISKIIHLLKKSRHIRNQDRQTLILFLKDINIPINETISLFRAGFNLSSTDFDKNFLYNIRHSYGLEGKKANYKGFSCARLSSSKNSQLKSCCPCVDDKEFIKTNYKHDIEEIFKDRNNTSRCTRILESFTDEKYVENVISPFHYFIIYKNSKKANNKFNN